MTVYNNTAHANVNTGNTMRPEPYIKNTGNEGMLRVGERLFLGEEHTDWLPNTLWSALKSYL